MKRKMLSPDTENTRGTVFSGMNKLDQWIQRIIRGAFRLIHRELKDSTLESLVQFVKFGLVGATNTAISYGINVLVLKLLQPYNLGWDYIAGNVIAFILSVLWSFYWNNRYVFTQKEGQKRNTWKALLKTYISYGFTGILLTNILSYVWIDIFGISKYIAPLINLIISIPLNFIINKLWAFKTQPEENRS